jgi:hypothetical protein
MMAVSMSQSTTFSLGENDGSSGLDAMAACAELAERSFLGGGGASGSGARAESAGDESSARANARASDGDGITASRFVRSASDASEDQDADSDRGSETLGSLLRRGRRSSLDSGRPQRTQVETGGRQSLALSRVNTADELNLSQVSQTSTVAHE